MTAAQKLDLISVEDYLAGELESQVKHEYLGGIVYALAVARDVHDLPATFLPGCICVCGASGAGLIRRT
jgi:hypothetical protein